MAVTMVTTRRLAVIVFVAIAVYCVIAYWPNRAGFRADISSTVIHSGRRSKSEHDKKYDTLTPGRRSNSKNDKEYDTLTPGRRSKSKNDKEYVTLTPGHRSKSKNDKEYVTLTPGRRSKSKNDKEYVTLTPGRRSKSKNDKEYVTLTPGRRSKSKNDKEYVTLTPDRRSKSKNDKEYVTLTPGRRSKSKNDKEYVTLTPDRRSKSKNDKEYVTLTPGRRSKSKNAKDTDLPMPDTEHPVLRLSSLANLDLVERAAGIPVYTVDRERGKVGDSNRTIVFQFRANTSTFAEPAPDAGHVSAMFMGRTGNRMLIYAGLYGIARRNGMHHVISANNPLLKLFKLNVTVVDSDRPGRDWVQYVVRTRAYDKRTEYLDPRIDVELIGYFNQWQYIANVMQDLLQHHIRLRDNIQRQADDFLLRSLAKFDLTSSDVALIGVHIRRTDLLARRLRRGNLAGIPSVPYYRHAVAFMDRLFYKQTMYVVCSDDIEWAKLNFVASRPVVYSVGNSADVDFAVLASCNHSVISMGSFGRWTATLAGGVTVTYSPKAPTQVPLSAARRRLKVGENPMHAWIALS